MNDNQLERICKQCGSIFTTNDPLETCCSSECEYQYNKETMMCMSGETNCAMCGRSLELTYGRNGDVIDHEGHYWEPGEVTETHYFECDDCRTLNQ